ncbi:DUF5681 domain-containing protein [Neogemmobacter tilapiae]|uniref:DUF5681 domain-containing protein n=1 Tax=Neogemmobacter tilapiae TaxID=875041 RepID=A0A918TXD3_9RHOB|nr:DUF5681 domain-containing protein [Gemmobacter tilapiae]GHC66499.1 hypothetical protein GCM10007315_34090 [Gemmobacter tilapiae]
MAGNSRPPREAASEGAPEANGKTSDGGRFQKGQSGNPKGRPKKPAPPPRPSAMDVIIDRKLTLTRDGVPREITMEEALQHRTYQEAIAGKRMAEREVLKWIRKREAWFAKQNATKGQTPIALKFSPDPDNADAAMLILGIASPDPAWASDSYYGSGEERRLRLLLEPWAVQQALARRRSATAFDSRDVTNILRCTRDSANLVWPSGRRK